MAKAIEGFTARKTRAKYPWAEWADGQCWLLEHGIDFKVGRDSFRQAAYDWSRRHGLPVTISYVNEHDLEIQFSRNS